MADRPAGWPELPDQDEPCQHDADPQTGRKAIFREGDRLTVVQRDIDPLKAPRQHARERHRYATPGHPTRNAANGLNTRSARGVVEWPPACSRKSPFATSRSVRARTIASDV